MKEQRSSLPQNPEKYIGFSTILKVLNLSTVSVLNSDKLCTGFFVAKEIVEALKSYKNLKSLELKGNTLGIKAAEAVGDALKLHPTFEVTYLITW